VWAYDDAPHTSTLAGLKIICRDCNLVAHFGRALNAGFADDDAERKRIPPLWHRTVRA